MLMINDLAMSHEIFLFFSFFIFFWLFFAGLLLALTGSCYIGRSPLLWRAFMLGERASEIYRTPSEINYWTRAFRRLGTVGRFICI